MQPVERMLNGGEILVTLSNENIYLSIYSVYSYFT
jgi:hypothetical protein